MPLPPLPPRAVHKEIRKVDATTSGNGANNRPGADDGYGADAEASLGPGEFSSDGSDLHLSDSSDGSDIDPNEMPSEYRSTSQDIKEDEMPGEFKLTAKTIQKGKLSRESESTGQNVKDEPSAEWSDSAASNEAALAPDGYGADEELSLRGEADASKKAGDRAAPAERPEAGNAQEIGPVQLPLPMGLWMNVAHIILEFDPQGSATRDGTLQPGDELVSVDGITLDDNTSIYNALEANKDKEYHSIIARRGLFEVRATEEAGLFEVIPKSGSAASPEAQTGPRANSRAKQQSGKSARYTSYAEMSTIKAQISWLASLEGQDEITDEITDESERGRGDFARGGGAPPVGTKAGRRQQGLEAHWRRAFRGLPCCGPRPTKRVKSVPKAGSPARTGRFV